ncbi:MAG TPA: acetyl-CoA carboxylase carboxyl transferase subunit beta [Spirochaetia bacterium]|nr:acetyl-CoA carboxylase carboxyl transferase subunit beta [Spirochaetia bacterium]
MWVKCPVCLKVIYIKDLEQNLKVCTCNYHFRLTAVERINLLADSGSFTEFNSNITSADPLEFTDSKESYIQKIHKTREKLNLNEGVITGYAIISGIEVVLASMEFAFLGGSMGSAIGEKIYRAICASLEKKIPLIIISCSGGARMHEGILSLMQMAKTSAGLAMLAEKKIPFISILADPTTGGVTASFASLGDIIIAEPGALVGFAGPRVIEQTIKQKLPEGFQRSEFLLDHGFIDIIVNRKDMKNTVKTCLDFFNK